MVAIEDIVQLERWQPEYKGEPPISDGILEPGAAVLIFGPAKSWKSMGTLHTAFSIAAGTPWFGFKTSPCVVIILQAELPKALFRKREIKFRKNFPVTKDMTDGNNPLPNLFFETNRNCKLNTTYGKDVLNSTILEAKARFPNRHIVVILDPIYLLMSGNISDESDVRAMLDNLGELRDRHNLSFVIIHHSHKTRVTESGEIVDTGADELHGSGAFNWWCDTVIRLKRLNPFSLDNLIGFTFHHTRNAERILPAFDVEWSRDTLQPVVVNRRERSESESDLTSRGLSDK